MVQNIPVEQPTFSIKTESAEQTGHVGSILGRLLLPGDFIALTGPLGAGKTCFARGILKGAGVPGHPASPSFTIVFEYEGRIPLYHMDMYRLHDPSELLQIGYDEYFYGDGACIVEWAEQVLPYLPEERLDVDIRYAGEHGRFLTFLAFGARHARILEQLEKEVEQYLGSRD
ncbi:MAG: tRNA (adenosine(37)-N6)-threonylcarbamoyltransferase complex ATPase subunit type 1 TsaE [Bacillota bacterium]